MGKLIEHAVAHDGDFATIIRTYNEVTERLKRSHELLTREVVRLREQLEEKNRELARRDRLAALGEMAAGVAHEIRNPLAGIGLYASLAARDLHDRPGQLDLVRRIGVGVQQLESIVADTLAFASDAVLETRTASVAELVGRSVDDARARIGGSAALIHMDESVGGIQLQCDPIKVVRALSNLIHNALEAAGVNGCVWIRTGPMVAGAGLIPIRVEDNGPGIDPSLLQRVFDPFFTKKSSGTGLGLAIVHRIAESHGGYVTAGNREEGGAVFTLALPTIPAESNGPIHKGRE